MMYLQWPHGKEHLITFLDGINNFHPYVKFSAEWSFASVTFLDTKVTIDDEGHLVTDVYVKPMDAHQYLHRCSCHPSHCNMAFLIVSSSGFAGCATGHKLFTASEQTEGLLIINRGYDKDEVQTQIGKATRLNRAKLLQSIKVETPLSH